MQHLARLSPTTLRTRYTNADDPLLGISSFSDLARALHPRARSSTDSSCLLFVTIYLTHSPQYTEPTDHHIPNQEVTIYVTRRFGNPPAFDAPLLPCLVFSRISLPLHINQARNQTESLQAGDTCRQDPLLCLSHEAREAKHRGSHAAYPSALSSLSSRS